MSLISVHSKGMSFNTRVKVITRKTKKKASAQGSLKYREVSNSFWEGTRREQRSCQAERVALSFFGTFHTNGSPKSPEYRVFVPSLSEKRLKEIESSSLSQKELAISLMVFRKYSLKYKGLDPILR